jgi:hypothetical protein
MRFGILALILVSWSSAFCQSIFSAPFNSGEQGKIPPTWTPPGMNFSAGPQPWRLEGMQPFVGTMQMPPRPLRALGNAHIDPQFVLHPEQKCIGVQPPGTLVAQNLYPELTLLPIGSQANARPLATLWPKLKIEPIPTVWPNLKLASVSTKCKECRLVPVTSSSQTIVNSQQK